MEPPALSMNGFLIVNKARGSHRIVKGYIVSGYHVEIGRHECSVSVDCCRSATNENCRSTSLSFICGESTSKWYECCKILGRERHEELSDEIGARIYWLTSITNVRPKRFFGALSL